MSTAPASTTLPIFQVVGAIPVEAFGRCDGQPTRQLWSARRTRKLVLLSIARYANPDGSRCYPSLALLAPECGLQENGVLKVVRWLCENGFLKIDTKGKRGQATLYIILIPEWVSSTGKEIGVDWVSDTGKETEAKWVSSAGKEKAVSFPDVDRNRFPDQETHQSIPTIDILTPSPPDGNRSIPITSGKDLPADSAKPQPGLPDWIPQESWDGFVEMRKKIKFPLTDHAQKSAIAKLEKFRAQGYSPEVILDAATFNCWRGLFVPKGEDGQPIKPDLQLYREGTWDEYNAEHGYHFDPQRNVWLDKNEVEV